MNFEITNEQFGDDTHLVAVSGEVDLYSAPELKADLHQAVDAGRTRLVVDLSGATFIDSTALGVLISAARRIRPVHGDLAVICTDHEIRRLFELTGLHRVFTMCETREQALGAATAS